MPQNIISNDVQAKAQASRTYASAVAAHKAGHLSVAEKGYRKVLKLAPNEPEPNYLLGAILLATDRLEEAISSLERCLATNPKHVHALNAIGSAYNKVKCNDKAIKVLEHALELEKNDPKVWFNLGLACVETNEYERAIDAFEEALVLDPHKWEALNGIGVCFLELGRSEQAISALSRCTEMDPQLEAAHGNLIRGLIQNEQFEEALHRSEQASERWSNNASLLVLMATSQKSLGKTDAALDCLHNALDIDPQFVPALNNLSGHLHDLGQWKKAEKYARRSLKIEPDSAIMLTLMGRIRQMRGDLIGAEEYYSDAIQADPSYAEAYNNLGNVLTYMDRPEPASQSFSTAIKLKPGSEGIRLNRAIAEMTQGNLYPACKDYLHRFNFAEERNVRREWSFPEWSMEPLIGKRLLLWPDQGIGDEILFARYAPMIFADCSYGALECSPRLSKLFQRSFPNTDVFAQTTPPQPSLKEGSFDFHSAIVDVCCARFESADNIPEAEPLRPDPTITNSLRKKYLALSDGRPLIGISWRSGGSHTSHFKSTPLSNWEKILSHQGCTFVNLQYGDVSKEVEEMNERIDNRIISDSEINPLQDLDPFAAQVAAMDLVITISNATAHFAGALGKPVWHMIPTGPGRLWYWFNQGSSSPWYKSMTLYRHRHNEGWQGVISQIHERLLDVTPQLGRKS
ncbi:MAG: tetratricopeptide repeat protein [Rhodospirillaceae bacterium]